MPSPMVAMGAYMVNALHRQLSAMRTQAGPQLSEELSQTAAGRKLLQVRQVPDLLRLSGVP